MLLVTLPSSRHGCPRRLSHPVRGKLMATAFSNYGRVILLNFFFSFFFLNQQSLKRKQSSRKGGGALC